MSLSLQALGGKLALEFDFFRGVVPEEPEDILESLYQRLGMEWVGASPGPKQYARSVGLWRSEDAMRAEKSADVVVSWGGNGDAHPGVLGRGRIARDLVPVVQDLWGHCARTTRVDSCVDFAWGYELIAEQMQGLHERRRVARDMMGVPEAGRTFYLGSKDAPVRCRCYEKGMKELPKMAQEERQAFHAWTRLELQYKPRAGREQGQAMQMDPLGVWGASRWSRELLGIVAGLNPPKLDRMPKMDRTPEERLAFMLRQYGRLFHEVGEERAMELVQAVFLGDLPPLTMDELRPHGAVLRAASPSRISANPKGH